MNQLIDKTLPLYTVESYKHDNGHVKRDAWYKEMEKARQTLMGSNQNQLTHHSNDNEQVAVHCSQHSVPQFIEELAINNTHIATDKYSRQVNGSIVDYIDRYSSDFYVTGKSGFISNETGYAALHSIYLRLECLPNQEQVSRAVSYVTRFMAQEANPQNLQFLPAENGVKILLRDYLAQKNDIDNYLNKIESILKKFGIHISEIFVNGERVSGNDINKVEGI